MQPPYRRPFDEDDDPDDEPLSPLDLRGSYRNRADADDEPDADRPSLLARTSGLVPDRKPPSRDDDKDKGGGFKMPFRRSADEPKGGTPSRSPFGVRGDDPREESGGRRLPLPGRGKDDKKDDDKKSGRGIGLPFGKSDKQPAKPEKKDSGGSKFGLPLPGRGKDDKKDDRPARPALGGAAPSRLPGKSDAKDEKKGGLLGGVLGRNKDDKPDNKSSARPTGIPPRRSSPFDEDDARPGRLSGSSSPPPRSGESSFRSPLGGGPSDRSPAQRSPLGGSSDRERSPFGGPARSPLDRGESTPPRRSPFDDDDDGPGGLPTRSSGLGTSRPADRPAAGSPLDRSERSPLGGRREEPEKKSGGGLLGKLRRGKDDDKAAGPPGPKAARSTSRALPQTTKAPRIVKHGLDLDRKLDLIGVSLVGFALVVFFAVLPSMSFGLLPPVTGGLTGTINHILSQLFGWGKIVWPLTSAVIGLWLMMRYFGGQMFEVDYFRVVGAISLYACALTWLHFFELVNDPAPTVEAFREISYAVAVEEGQGGGWFGHQFYLMLLSQLGDLGAVSVMIAWLVVSLMLTFDVSLVELGQFLAAALAVFSVSPAERARKREAQETAQAPEVGVTRPGEKGPRPRQMPLAPSTAAAGVDGGSVPAADASGLRPTPVIRRPGSAEPAASGEPSAAAPVPGAAQASISTEAAEAEAPAKEGKGLFSRTRIPGLRRSSAPEKPADGEASDSGKVAAAAAAGAVAGAGLGGRFGRMLRRNQPDEGEKPDAAETPAAEPMKQEQAPSAEAAATLLDAESPVGETPDPEEDRPFAPPRRMSGFSLPPRDRAASAPDDEDTDAAEEDAAPELPGRPLPAAGLRRADDETPASGLTVRPPERAEPAATIGSTPDEATDETSSEDEAEPITGRALPFANPFQRRPSIEPRKPAEPAQAEKNGDAPESPEPDADEVAPPVRPGREEPPPRRVLPFRDEPAAPVDRAPLDAPPIRERSPFARPAESESVRSFLDDINLPKRPSANGSDTDDAPTPASKPDEKPDEAQQSGSGLGAAVAGAALLGAAAGLAASSGDRDAKPETPDGESETAPARPVGLPQREFPRPGAATLTDEDEDDLDLLDDEDDLDDEADEEEGLFDTPARPAGLVRPPQRPQTAAPPQRPEPRASDAGVRAANEFTQRMAHEDPEQTRPSDDFTRRAPAPKSEPPSRPVTTTNKPKRVEYTLPDIGKTLKAGKEQRVNDDVLLAKAKVIEDTLASFGAPGKVVEVNPGPVITQFGVEPDYLIARSGKKTRVKVGSIARLDADLALALAAKSIRIEAPVPGKGFVGIEVPNDENTLVTLRDVIESQEFKRIQSKLAIALGLGVDGTPVAADLTAMPHLLIAGTTGSGKSVCVNAIITCLLAKNTPEDVQFIMVDPKRVELTGYNGIPHLVAPVVVDLERIVGVLQWVQREMEDRYRRFADTASRNILDYNRKLSGDQPKMPYLVVVIDELADLMMLAPDETERLLARLAQMARATGIHLIISTQRPSVDIITGLIKANFPARIAFAVASSVDSRVILDQPGAEKLLGRGDMLYQSPDAAAPLRMQGVFVSDEEINAITSHWRLQARPTGDGMGRSINFNAAPMDGGRSGASLPMSRGDGQPSFWDAPGAMSFDSDYDEGSETDELYREAVEIVQNLGRASISLLQRRLRIGYTRAARLIDMMEEEGIVGPAESGSKPREVLKFD